MIDPRGMTLDRKVESKLKVGKKLKGKEERMKLNKRQDSRIKKEAGILLFPS